MTSTRSVYLTAAILLLGLLSGCKDKDEAREVLPQVCESFPDAVIYKVDPRVLWIQTHVDGVSAKIADTMFQQGCQQAVKSFGKLHFNIGNELNFDGRQILVLGFRKYAVLWEVQNGTDSTGIPLGYQLMTWPQAEEWLKQHLGYEPKPDRIRVVTLQDLKDSPKGKPMHLQTLAEIQQQKRQALEQHLQQLDTHE